MGNLRIANSLIKGLVGGGMKLSNATKAHPLNSSVATTREKVNQWLITKQLRRILPVVNVISAGRAVELFDKFGVLDLSGNSSEKTLSEEYVHRLLDENETLDALFELEAPAIFHRNGF